MTAPRHVRAMKKYWEERAALNAAWYVDTTVDWDEPDMDRFFETGRRIVAEAMDEAPPTVTPPAGHQLAVEIGSGLGRVCAALAERFDRVIGIDVADGMVSRARQLVDRPDVSFEVGDGMSLQPVPDASADLVLSFTVFQHVLRPSVIEGYLADAARVLRPGGLLVFQWNSTTGTTRWWLRRSLLYLVERSGLRRQERATNAPAFLGTTLSVARVRRALERTGLELLEVRGAGTLFTWAWARAPGG
ncbi:MAG TPA: class I SAM-dependent methyltransferase [Acidimicrobiales bacterium]|nr:class I SAM-dependent methyltransferase [Acidimicrobiales bacterium]